MELTRIMFPEPQAAELREIMTRVRQDHDLKRAAMFLKLIRRSYASGGKSFACRPFSVRSLYKPIMQFSRRSKSLIIENQDFEVLIKHYDSPTAFVYCDPPYFSSEYVYDCEFTWDDHIRLRDALMGIQGKFLLSYNDCEEVRELYKGCTFFDFTRRHTMVQRYEAGKEFPELLVANYDIYERERAKPSQLTLFGAPPENEITMKARIIS